MEQDPSSEAHSFSTSQEILHILWNPTAHYHDHYNPPLVPILSQINLLHPHSISSISISKLSSHLCPHLPSVLSPSGFPPKLCMHFSSPTYVPHAHLSYSPWLHLPSNLSTWTIPTRLCSNDRPLSFDTIYDCKYIPTFTRTDLCLGRNGGVWRRKWVRDTQQQQAIMANQNNKMFESQTDLISSQQKWWNIKTDNQDNAVRAC